MATEIKYIITQHNAMTGETVVREMTDEEYAQYEASIANAQPLPSAE
jgi:hypothetical protein